MKGYKIHIERVKNTNGEITRTIKYLLTPTNPQTNQDKTVFNFIYDDTKIRGLSNIPDYLKNKNNYDLFDFWIDTLKAGIIFQPNAKFLEYLI